MGVGGCRGAKERDVEIVLGVAIEKDGEEALFWCGITIFWSVVDICYCTSIEKGLESTCSLPILMGIVCVRAVIE